MKTRAQRFWGKVDKRGPNECWLWCGSKDADGYGMLGEKGYLKAHRFAYELSIGSIPEGLEIDHLCRDHACVNPKHLEAVTHRENVLRGDGVAALCARQTHCIHGHEFTKENTYLRSRARGGRQCKACTRDAELRRAKPRIRKLATLREGSSDA